jgi:hypothetical protein
VVQTGKRITKKIIILSILCLILIVPFAHAWGITFIDNHFTLKQGQKHDIKFTLQNYVGDDTKRVVVKLSGDSEIASIINEQDYYLLPPKTKDHEVIIHLDIPEKAKKEYKVDVNFIAYSGGSGIGLSTAKVIPVYIEVSDGTLTEEKTEEKPLDLTETYQEIEEKIQEEGKSPDGAPVSKAHGLAVLEEKSSGSSLIPIVLLAAGIIGTIITVTVYLQKKNRKKLEL